MKGQQSRKKKIEAAAEAAPVADSAQVVSGVEFLLQMVETQQARRNGTGKMESDSKAEVELAKIEKQLEQLQATPGQSNETRRMIQQLHDRVDALRHDVHSGFTAWERRNWRGTRSVLIHSTTSNVSSPTGARFTETVRLAKILRSSLGWRASRAKRS